MNTAIAETNFLEPSHRAAILALINTLLEKKAWPAAYSLAASSIADFPEDETLYLNAAHALSELGRLDEADQICLDGIANIPGAVRIHEAYGKVAVARKDYPLAATRWLALRQNFPNAPEGFQNGVETAILLKDWRQVAEICKQGLKQPHDWLKSINIPSEAAAPILEWAKEVLPSCHYTEALRRLNVFIALFPRRLDGYSESAKAYMAIRHPQKAQQVCLEAVRMVLPDSAILALLSEACWQQGKAREAINYTFLAADLGEAALIEQLLYRMLDFNAVGEAAELYKCHKDKLGDSCDRAKLEYALGLKARPDLAPKLLGALVEKCENFANVCLPLSADARFYLNALGRMAERDPQAARKHQALLESLVLPVQAEAKPSTRKKRLCIYDWENSLSFMAAVIRHIPPDEIDIVSRGNVFDRKTLNELGLGAYQCFDRSKVGDYRYLITDGNAYFHDKTKAQADQTVICYWHSCDATGAWYMPQVGAFILPFQKTAEFNAIKLIGEEHSLMRCLPTSKKCEIAATGLYHIEPPVGDKNSLRQEIQSKYGFAIPDDRPLVYIIHGDLCLDSHWPRAINSISDYATVIFKTLSTLPERSRKKLAASVNILQVDTYANNLLRYAADYILAEFGCGSVVSSIMLGLPLIPVYSRLCKNKHQLEQCIPQHYRMLIPGEDKSRHINFNRIPKRILLNYLDEHGLLFDLLDHERIRKTILSGTLHDILAPHLPVIQKEAFGGYLREGAAKKTAELIRRFAATGSFGDGCHAILFK